jgi:hypothetical protein
MVTTLKRAWQRLTGAAPGKTQADLAGKYTHSQALLAANNQVLTLMADMEEKLSATSSLTSNTSAPRSVNSTRQPPGSWRPSLTAWN